MEFNTLEKKYICPFCKEQIIGHYNKFNNHKANCKANPNYINKLERRENKKKERLSHFKDFTVICANCKKEFTVNEDDRKFPSKQKYFCCRSCANTRHHSKEILTKISNSLNNHYIESRNNLQKIKQWREKFKAANIFFHKKPWTGSYELDYNNPIIGNIFSIKTFEKLSLFGLDLNKLYTPEIINEYEKCKNLLYNEYYVNKLSTSDIYIKYNCKKEFNSIENLVHFLRGILGKLRNLHESTSLCIMNGKLDPLKYFGVAHPRGNCQWHTTWDNRQVFLRSNLEKDYAEILDKKQIHYTVESLHIKYFNTKTNLDGCAIPDFYIPSTNTIVEIKSTGTLDLQNMKDKFKAYIELGYNCKLILNKQEVDINTL